MLAVLLLAGCLVLHETLAFEEYEEYYDDDPYDPNEVSTPLSGAELARVRRYPGEVRTRDPEELNDINDNTTNSGNITKGQISTRGDNYDDLTTISRNEYILPNHYSNSTEYDSVPTIGEDGTTVVFNGVARKVPERTAKRLPPDANKQEKKKLFAYINSMTGGAHRNTTNAVPHKDPLRLQMRFTRRTTTKPIRFDIDKFLEIVTNLTIDYYTNLTDQVNVTLMNMSVPTCGTPATPTTRQGFLQEDYIEKAENVIGKCYVCGLEDRGIPDESSCGDAFGSDFMSFTPEGPSATGQIGSFKKYCRYRNVDNYQWDRMKPLSVFGRWTGGCSVRWSDITSLYTQRTCRNRRRPTMGSHFASRRMATLEMTLSKMDDGCIISPVATLLPLNRGVSLYARFYACVCTGNWCNRTFRFDSDMWMTSVMALTAITPWFY